MRSSRDQQLANWLGGTRLLVVVDQLVLSVGTIILVEVCALAFSHYSQNPESASNVIYSFTALLLELIKYNYNVEIVIVQQLLHWFWEQYVK